MAEEDFFEKAVSLVEALIFASASPVKPQAMKDLLVSQDLAEWGEQLDIVLTEVAHRYADHAIALYAIAGGWQFRTREDVAPALQKIVEKPRRLSRSAMETLAVVAYHQPCTRAEVEAIRGVSLGQNVLDSLLEEGLLMPKGRKEVPGRPVLWATTPMFLSVFGLNTLADLPRRDELVAEESIGDEGAS
ncbi:SMC-Scp complex subunit ScpB [Saccharibacter sp. 17.LH.SD]|uniref:SMC-Scp complex subunit ScpB n=1 Tax=Saccharibacter sp. 17.LH.SD TaxID=2689393 RepID=UPI0019288FDB|nr:SMC-Scp complex subunit ScpB [Saccharibacter sp. 17.LH.SD]